MSQLLLDSSEEELQANNHEEPIHIESDPSEEQEEEVQVKDPEELIYIKDTDLSEEEILEDFEKNHPNL